MKSFRYCEICRKVEPIDVWWDHKGDSEESEFVSLVYKFTPYVDTTIAPKPVEITSPSHREQLMKENHMEVRPREHIDDLNQRRWKLGMAEYRGK